MNYDKYVFIVGKGDLASIIVSSAKKQGMNFVIAGIKGLSDKNLVSSHEHFWFKIGHLEALLDHLSQHGVTKIILVGSISRPSFFNLSLDSLGARFLRDYGSQIGGDSSLLSCIVSFFENRGFAVVGAHVIEPQILAQERLYTNKNGIENYLQDIAKGFNIAKGISGFDIGQSIVFQQGSVVAVEAVEGTKNMVLRSKKLLKNIGPKGILIKVKKSIQDDRVDLPTIGEQTVKQVHSSGLFGIIIEAKSSIFINQAQAIYLANKYGIFIMAVESIDSIGRLVEGY